MIYRNIYLRGINLFWIPHTEMEENKNSPSLIHTYMSLIKKSQQILKGNIEIESVYKKTIMS